MFGRLLTGLAALAGMALGFYLWSTQETLPLLESAKQGDDILDRFHSDLKPVLPKMVTIPAGTFMMGRVKNDPNAFSNEHPSHEVRIGRAFQIGKYEVSFREYDVFARMTRRRLPDDNGWGRGRHPVINVSWQDAVDYAKWLSQKTGKKYRLPSEAEWEYAARANTTTVYWWGNQLGENHAQCSDCAPAVFQNKTALVGSFAANAFGVFDTAGNVTEWTQDCYADNFTNTPRDGTAYIKKNCLLRTIRGGSWYNKGITLRSSHRSGLNPNKFNNNGGGFRLARDL